MLSPNGTTYQSICLDYSITLTYPYYSQQYSVSRHPKKMSHVPISPTTPPCSVKVSLRDHQHRIVNALLTDRPNVLFVAGTGSGKTISAIVAGMCLLTNRKIDGVVIVTPTGVHEQFAHEVKRLVPKSYQATFSLHTHHKFFHHDTKYRNTLSRKLLVVDEAHALATTITRDRKTNAIANGKMAYQATLAAQHAAHVFLLTATPLKNTPTELFNLACMVRRKPYEAFYKEHTMYKQALEKLFREYLRTGNEYLLQRQRKRNLIVQTYVEKMNPFIEFAHCSREGFPSVTENIQRLIMDKEYLELYNRAEQDMVQEEFHEVLDHNLSSKDAENAGVPLQLLFDPNKANYFFCKVRVAVNGITENVISKKVKYALDVIYKCYNHERRVLIYSNFLNGGLSLITRELEKSRVPYLLISGSTTAIDRRRCVELFNQGVVPVLLISAAGSEGLDLKCVRDVVILEPHFHDVRIEQVIGRAVRFRSHDMLPPEDRTVTIHRLLLCKPTKSGDTWEAIERHNQHIVNQLLDKHAETYISHGQVPVIDMHPMYKALLQNTMHNKEIPQNRFKIKTQRKDDTITVSIQSKYAIVRLFQSPVGRYLLKPPPTDISVDDLLHRMAARKKRFLEWHLRHIRRSDRMRDTRVSTSSFTPDFEPTINRNNRSKKSNASRKCSTVKNGRTYE